MGSMKLRKINARRYVDDETGTYYRFLSDTTPEKARDQIERHLRVFLNNGGMPDDWHGSDRTLPRLARRSELEGGKEH